MTKIRKSAADQKGWTEVQRHPMPMGDALYTVNEMPEVFISDCIETHIETILVDGGTTVTDESSFRNSTSACSSQTTLSEDIPVDFGHGVAPRDRRLLIPGGDFEVPRMVDEWSEESLDYWKSRLELMEEQKKHIREWMAETTLKISRSIQKMKDVAEKLRNDLTINQEESISRCETSDAVSQKAAGDDATSYFDPTSLIPVDESPTIYEPIEELPVDAIDQTTADSEELPHHDDDPPQTATLFRQDKLASAHGYLDFKEFASSPTVAEQSLVHTIKPQVLQAMELLNDGDWDKVKKLYIVLKRVGRVDRLLVYELSNEVLRTEMVGGDTMEVFLSSVDLEPAEAKFLFGKALLLLYHASVLLGGQGSSIDNLDLDLFPELRQRTKLSKEVLNKDLSICPRLCRQALKKSTVERILKKQGDKLSEMLYGTTGYKASGSPPNPAYAHVKSRYMEGLKKRIDVSPPSKRNRLNQMDLQAASNITKKSACQRPKVKMLTGYEKSRIVIAKPRSINREEWAELDHNKNKMSLAVPLVGIPTTSPSAVGEGSQSNRTEKLMKPQTPSPPSSASAHGDDSSTSTVIEKGTTSISKSEILAKAIYIPSIVAPTNSMESMSIASASFEDQSSMAPAHQCVADFFAYDLSVTNFSSGDFHKPSLNPAEDIREMKCQATKTKLTMGIGSANKPSWELLNKSHSESLRRRNEVTEKSEALLHKASSAHETTPEAQKDGPKRLTAKKSFVVLLKDKYVGVKFEQKSSQYRDLSPSRYYPAEEKENEGMIRKLYKNLPSLRPVIVDVLLTNIVVAYLLAITGEAFCDKRTLKQGIICSVSHNLRKKLRSILIRALHLVDDF